MFWCFKILSVTVYTRADTHLLFINYATAAAPWNEHFDISFCVHVNYFKPAISHFYSFVLSLLFQLVNNILFSTKQRKKLAAVKLAK